MVLPLLAALTFHTGVVIPSDVQTAVDIALHRPVNPYGTSTAQVAAYLQRRVPPCVPPSDGDAWSASADELRRQVLETVIFRGVSQAWRDAPPDVQWGDTIETGHGYRIRKLRYTALPGLVVPALLYEPDAVMGKAPGVLNVNGHYYVEGKAKDEEQIRCADLAKQGFVALHPEWLGCGELNVDGMGHNSLSYLDLCGVSGVAVFYLAMQKALEVLAALPHVDAARIAMTGLSGGGWQTILLSALDTRIALSAPNAGYIGMAQRIDNLREVGDLEQAPVDLVWKADYTHLTALLAPRPALLLYNAMDDCCFTAARARTSVYEPLVAFYELYGRPDRFAFHANLDPGNHNYGRDHREQFYAFLKRHVAWNREAGIGHDTSDDEVLAPETLHCGIPEGNATLHSLADQLLAEVPRPSMAKTTDALREVLRYPALRVTRTETVAESVRGGVTTTHITLEMAEWSVPAVVLCREDAHPSVTTLVFGDAGKAHLTGMVSARVQRGERVVAVDPLMMGESNERPDQDHYYAMLLATMGERALGIQASQLAATVQWLAETFPDTSRHMEAQGWNASVAAVASMILGEAPVASLNAIKAPQSLKALIHDRVRYEERPALFCFGLLEGFDIADLTSLAGPADITWDVGAL